MAKLKFNPPTIIQKSPAVQLRIAASEYEGIPRMDIREWVKPGDAKEYKPTKNGTSIPVNLVDQFLTAVSKHAAELPRRVVDSGDSTRWIIAVDIADVQFKKDAKHVYMSEDEARAKNPPDGYRLFEAKIVKGTVTTSRKLAYRKGGEWKEVSAKSAPATKTTTKVKTRR